QRWLEAAVVNGCAYCLDMHNKNARAADETEQRLYVLFAWRESVAFHVSAREGLPTMRKKWKVRLRIIASRLWVLSTNRQQAFGEWRDNKDLLISVRSWGFQLNP